MFVDDIVFPEAYYLQGTLSVDIIDDVTNRSAHLAYHISCENIASPKECVNHKQCYRKIVWCKEAVGQHYKDTGRYLQNVINY